MANLVRLVVDDTYLVAIVALEPHLGTSRIPPSPERSSASRRDELQCLGGQSLFRTLPEIGLGSSYPIARFQHDFTGSLFVSDFIVGHLICAYAFMTVQFHATPFLPSYLVTLAVGRFV